MKTNGELVPISVINVSNCIYVGSKFKLKQMHIQILSFYIFL